MASLPSGVGYGTVKWTAVAAVVDSTTDTDAAPDVVPVLGTVSFSPSVSVFRVPNSVPPVTMFVDPVTATIYSDGTLRDTTGRIGVTLVSTDSTGLDVKANSWYWTATFNLTGHSRASFPFQLSDQQVVDLTSIAPVSTSSAGTPITQGRGVTGATIDNTFSLILTYSDGSTQNAGYVGGQTAVLANATTTKPGAVQLAGDLSGTATSPTVPGLATKVNSSTYSAGITAAQNRANHTGTQVSSTISDLAEAVQDIVAAMLAGQGTYNDAAGTFQLNAGTGGGTVTPDTTAPSITSFIATPGNTSAVLSWTASDNVGVSRYTVTAGSTLVYSGSSSSTTLSGLTNGVAYTWTLTAFDAAGNTRTATATATPSVNATTRASLTVSTPSVSGTTAVVSWITTLGNDGVTPDSVTSSRSGTDSLGGGAFSSSGDAITGSRTYSNLIPGVTYQFTEQLIKSGSNYGTPVTVTASIPTSSGSSDTTPPTTPTVTLVNGAGGTSVTVNWSASTDDTAVVGYRIMRNGTQIATGITAKTYVDSTTSPSTAYTYSVQAYDAAGNYSVAGTKTTTTSASTPATISMDNPTVSGSAVTINWTTLLGSDGVTPDSVTTSRDGVDSTGFGAFSATGDPINGSRVFNSLVAGSTYNFTIQMIKNGANYGSPITKSATISGTPTVDTTAPTITAFSGTVGSAQVALAWTASDNVAVTSYTVTRGGTQIYTGTATTFTDTGLTNGTAYSYTLTARDAAGNSKTATVTYTPTSSTSVYQATYPAIY